MMFDPRLYYDDYPHLGNATMRTICNTLPRERAPASL